MTWDDVSGNDEIMLYLTGLVKDARDWLIPLLETKVTRGGKKIMLWWRSIGPVLDSDSYGNLTSFFS